MINAIQEIAVTDPGDLRPLAVDLKTAAKLLGISDRNLHSLKQDGEIPHVRIGNRVLFSIESLKTFILQNEKGGHDAD